MRPWLLLALAAALGALPSRALAQMKHGFVEPCTMSNVAERHLDCVTCPSAFGQRECRERLEPRGYTRKCRTQGGHQGWDEIWCAPLPPPEQESETVQLLLGALGTLAAMVLVMKLMSRTASPERSGTKPPE